MIPPALLFILKITLAMWGVLWLHKGTKHPFPYVPSFIWAESPCFVDYELEGTQ